MMIKKISIIIVLTIFISAIYCSNKIFAQEESLSAGEIIIRSIQAYGGEKALREISNKNDSMATSDFYNLDGEFLGTDTFYYKKPNKIMQQTFNLSQTPTITMRKYNNGKISIVQDGMAVDDALQLELFKKICQAQIKTGGDDLFYLLEHQQEASFLGERSIGIGVENCFAIELNISEDVRNIFFFDPATFLIMRKDRFISMGTYEDATQIYFDDFRDLGGVLFPFHLRIYRNNELVAKVRVRKISFDELEDELFE